MNLVNLTPHPINIYNKEGTECILTVPPQAKPARMIEKVEEQKIHKIGWDSTIPIVKKSYGSIDGLPEAQEDIPGYYLVSLPVLLSLRASGDKRQDIACPDTGPDSVVRDEQGHILGVRRFQL